MGGFNTAKRDIRWGKDTLNDNVIHSKTSHNYLCYYWIGQCSRDQHILLVYVDVYNILIY